jgi:predicted RNA methylase
MSEIQDYKNTPSPLQHIHSWHYDMLINQERSQFYSDLIRENCRNKIVLEIGTGSGLLAVLAIKHGAKKVICCEENPLLAMAAMQLFKRLNLEDRIQLISKNSKDMKTDEIPAVDVVLHELFASDPFGEEMVPTLKDARRFMKADGIFLPEKIQIIYHPIRNRSLQEKLYFEDIELIEMRELLSQVHPALRVLGRREPEPETYALPEVAVSDLLETSYNYLEVNDKLVDVDAVEVSFFIVHGPHRLQAAKFEAAGERVHWYPLVFYKLDINANKLRFAVKDQTQLTID